MKYFQNFDLTNFNSYRLNSTCNEAFFPESEQDIIELYNKRQDYILLGSGHNVILSKNHYETPFIIYNGNFNAIEVDKSNQILSAESGANMIQLNEIALENEFGGVEMFYDIPSSVGGAVVMNAGAGGEEIKDILIKVRYLDLNDMVIKEIENKDISFKYRNSIFQRDKSKIVLKAWFQLFQKNKEEVRQKMEHIKQLRHSKQPKDFPNAGSVFKRPDGHFVGPMIDELGLKGYFIGGAMVSKKHSGFIVNFNNATGKDIIDLIEFIKKQVFERFDVKLEAEQRII